MASNPLHTEANAIPSVNGTPLGDVLDDLANIHPGIDLIRDGLRLIAHDRLTTDQTQTLTVTLAGSTDGTDVVTAIGLAVARLTDPDTNPALRGLDLNRQKNAQGWGAYLAFTLARPDIHQPASEASAAITEGTSR